MGQDRSTQRYVPLDKPLEMQLVIRMHQLSKKHPRYGYRRIHALLRKEGFKVNNKRIQRLWAKEGLKVPQKQRKRRRLGSDGACARRRAAGPNEVWSYDFCFDTTASGRTLKFLAVIDEYTKESLAIEVGRRITHQDVIEVIDTLIGERDAPTYIRSDNGPEFIADKLKQHLASNKIKTMYIEPGSPWENPFVESFIDKFKDELLKGEVFDSLLEARVLTENYRKEYNQDRPHSTLGYLTPVEFAKLTPLTPSGATPLQVLRDKTYNYEVLIAGGR